MYQFGSGILMANPNGGNLATNPTGVTFGTLQNVAVDIKQDLKELRGLYQFPDNVAPGNRTITIKAEFGDIDGRLFNNLFFGDTQATGGLVTIYQESAAIPSATPYTYTVANATGFAHDYGVKYAGTGISLERVATPTAAGQYSVDVTTGTYTFDAADTGVTVLFSYDYAQTTAGYTYGVNQQLMGYGPVFQLSLTQQYSYSSVASGMQANMLFHAVRSGSLSMPTKQDNFQIATVDMQAFADASGNVLSYFAS